MHDPNESVRVHVKKSKKQENNWVLLRVQSKYDVTTVLDKCYMHKSWSFFIRELSTMHPRPDQTMDRQFSDHYTETDCEHNQNFSEHVNGASDFVTYFTINYNFVLVEHDGYGPEHIGWCSVVHCVVCDTCIFMLMVWLNVMCPSIRAQIFTTRDEIKIFKRQFH